MSAIEILRRTVYRAPTKGRAYLTARAAANAEAGAMLAKKYPSERAEYDVGFSGWNWSLDEQLIRVHARLSKRILRKLRSSVLSQPPEQS